MSDKWLVTILGATLTVTISGTIEYYTSNNIPKTDKVQQGYVIPSKLEIELQDLDGNGQKEVLMKYDGKKYLLILDEKGRPRVQAYEVKPAEILWKE